MPLSKFGIENIPQSLPKKVEGEHNNQYGYPRHKREPGRVKKIILTI
jgi:hypothetical protein